MSQAITQIVFASGNKGKLREVAEILNPFQIEVIPQAHFNVPDIEETGLTFVENAILKARNCCEHTGLPALADDSGIEIDALKGAPGIYSARYGGEHGNGMLNIQRVLHEMKNVPDGERSARFQCLMVLMRHELDPVPIIAQGTWEGEILTAPKGEGGFGYDPIFHVAKHQCSAAELTPQQKHQLSHRGQALVHLQAHLKKL